MSDQVRNSELSRESSSQDRLAALYQEFYEHQQQQQQVVQGEGRHIENKESELEDQQQQFGQESKEIENFGNSGSESRWFNHPAIKLSKAETQKEFEEKLLSGWTMLGRSCPISGYPLVWKDGVTYSIPCQCPVVDPASAGSASGSVATSSNNGTENNRPNHDDRSSTDSRLRSQVQPQSHSPMKASSMDNTGHTQSESAAGAAGTAMTAATASTASSSSTRTEQKSGNEISKLMGEKLMMGWVMLNETCPVTNACPLMQNPVNKQKWSPALNDYLDIQGDALQSNVVNADELHEEPQYGFENGTGGAMYHTDHFQSLDAIPQGQSTRRIQERENGYPLVSRNSNNNRMNDGEQGLDSGGRSTAAVSQREEETGGKPSPMAPTNGPIAGPQSTTDPNLNRSIRILDTKIAEASDLLEQMSLTSLDDINLATNLSKLIQHSAMAIRALKTNNTQSLDGGDM